MRFISHCAYGGEITVECADFDDPLKLLDFGKGVISEKTGSSPVGGICGRYIWQEIWTAAAKVLNAEVRSAPEWIIYKSIPLVRDRFVVGDIVHLFIDGEQLRSRILSMANGSRVVREIEEKSPDAFRKLETEPRRAAS